VAPGDCRGPECEGTPGDRRRKRRPDVWTELLEEILLKALDESVVNGAPHQRAKPGVDSVDRLPSLQPLREKGAPLFYRFPCTRREERGTGAEGELHKAVEIEIAGNEA
jgi:hypothetical protein